MRTCMNCGTPVGLAKCKSCGNDMAPGTKFCGNCGTTVSWTAEALPGLRAVAGGSFDDPQWFRIDRHGWMRSGHRWFVAPQGVETFEKSALLKK